MKAIINFRNSDEELPEVKVIKIANKKHGFIDYKLPERSVFIVFEGTLMKSNYIFETGRFSGLTMNQKPKYWQYVTEFELEG